MNSSRTTNLQLIQLASRYHIPLNAICNKDILNRYFPHKGAYIVNMQDSTEGAGRHWVAIWLDTENGKNVACYFDSFGIDPPLDVIDFMRRFVHRDGIIHMSQKDIQNINGGHCGQYCIDFFIHMMNPRIHSIKKKYNFFLDYFKAY